MFEIKSSRAGQFELRLDGKPLLRHDGRAPALFLGRGREDIRMFRGNFDIRDRVDERLALRLIAVEGNRLRFAHPDIEGETLLCLSEQDGFYTLKYPAPIPQSTVSGCACTQSPANIWSAGASSFPRWICAADSGPSGPGSRVWAGTS